MTTRTVEVEVDDGNGDIVKAYALQENHWWSTDYYLTPIILDALIQFKDNHKHGVPSSFVLDKSDSGFKIAEQEWRATIDRMILAFELIKRDNDGEIPEFYDKVDFKYDKELYKKQQEQIEEGLLLFAKYFRGLWD